MKSTKEDCNKGKWAIVGGGIMGMTLALGLSKKGYKVTIFESADKLGGLAGSCQMGSLTWDRFYHVISMSDHYTRKIIDEIGLKDEIRWAETKTGFLSNGKLYSMSNLVEFFKFPPINLFDKVRLGLTIYMASRIRNLRILEKQTVSDWLCKWSGKRVYKKVWLPLLKAKLGDAYNQASAAFIWSTIQRMYAARRSGLKKEMFGYVSGGYNRINELFAAHLKERDVEIHLNSRVKLIEKHTQNKFILKYGISDKQQFDYVISTLPSKPSVELAPKLSKVEREKHLRIKYLGVICPTIILRKSLSPFYVTNITDEWTPFTGIIEMTALIDPNEIDNKNLVYLPKYVLPHDSLFNADNETIRQIFLGSLFKIHDHLSESDIEYWCVSRAKTIFALPTLRYSEDLPDIRTSLGNYFIINSAQILNSTLNVNETIKVAQEKLEEILHEIK